ncbi:unnamed protein product [Arabis nemorensis]|uniref:Uncharacterized protein n=1 Tax=Arabis nemorensis TaxID=586526 RepID=A0A565AZ21_9BRAS|nr:unnamed protein product [Arabis nemorensis]
MHHWLIFNLVVEILSLSPSHLLDFFINHNQLKSLFPWKQQCHGSSTVDWSQFASPCPHAVPSSLGFFTGNALIGFDFLIL